MEYNPDEIIETFQNAAEENQLNSLRQHQLVTLPAEGELWVAGDIHDHRRNFDKFTRLADLANNPQRHLILQELIHGDHYDIDGTDGSWWMLYQAARLKCDFPDQVHFLLANHDLAQVHGEGIMKAGQSLCEAFSAGVKKEFGDDALGVNVAISEFFLSFPLAIRTPNGLFFSHSLPADDQMEGFDFSIFNRPLTGPDYKRRVGSVYQLIWGRNTTPAGATAFANKVGARVLITGHQPQEDGYAINGPRHLIVASDHNQGVFLPVNLSTPYEMPALVRQLKKFVALDL